MTVKLCLVIFLLNIHYTDLLSQTQETGTPSVWKYIANNVNKLSSLNVRLFHFGRYLSDTKTNILHEDEKHYNLDFHSWIKKTINEKETQSPDIVAYNFLIALNYHSNHNIDLYKLDVSHIEYANIHLINSALKNKKNDRHKNKKRCRLLNLSHLLYTRANTGIANVVLPVSNFIESDFGGITHDIHFEEHGVIRQFTLGEIMITCLALCPLLFIFAQQVVLSMTGLSKKSHNIVSSLSVVFFVILLINSNLEVLLYLIPGFSIKLYYQIWIFSMLSIPFRIRLIRLSFPGEVNPTIEKTIYIFFTLFILLTTTFSLELIVENGCKLIYISFIFVVYMYYVLTKAAVNHHEYAIVHILNLTIMTLLMVCNFFSPHQLTWHRDLSLICAVIYILIQSTTFFLKLVKVDKSKTRLLHEIEFADQTFRNLVELQTKELQKVNTELSTSNIEKNFVISTISHDLMNSFNVLLNLAREVSNDDSLPEKYKNNITMLYRAAKNGHYILEDMLEWTTCKMIDKPNLKPITCLSDMINKNLELQDDCLKQKNMHVKVDIDDALLFYCHEGHLNSILRNLISNAFKFSHKGRSIKIRNQQRNEWVQIIIQDEGIGIRPEICESLFNSTLRKSHTGTEGEKGAGIGLLIIRDLVERNNGQINFYSDQDQGTTFIVEFRLEPKHANETNINY